MTNIFLSLIAGALLFIGLQLHFIEKAITIEQDMRSELNYMQRQMNEWGQEMSGIKRGVAAELESSKNIRDWLTEKNLEERANRKKKGRRQ